MCCGRMSFANCGQSMTRAQLAGKVLAVGGVHQQKCLHQDTSYFTHPMLRCRTVKFRHCGICRNTSTSCGANCDGIGRGQNTKRVVVVGDRREWSDAEGQRRFQAPQVTQACVEHLGHASGAFPGTSRWLFEVFLSIRLQIHFEVPDRSECVRGWAGCWAQRLGMSQLVSFHMFLRLRFSNIAEGMCQLPCVDASCRWVCLHHWFVEPVLKGVLFSALFASMHIAQDRDGVHRVPLRGWSQ